MSHHSYPAPDGCHACVHCDRTDNLYLEDDENQPGKVRIGCLCDACLTGDKDDTRTNWCDSIEAAAFEWNIEKGHDERVYALPFYSPGGGEHRCMTHIVYLASHDSSQWPDIRIGTFGVDSDMGDLLYVDDGGPGGVGSDILRLIAGELDAVNSRR